jgi:hypothetical protein
VVLVALLGGGCGGNDNPTANRTTLTHERGDRAAVWLAGDQLTQPGEDLVTEGSLRLGDDVGSATTTTKTLEFDYHFVGMLDPQPRTARLSVRIEHGRTAVATDDDPATWHGRPPTEVLAPRKITFEVVDGADWTIEARYGDELWIPPDILGRPEPVLMQHCTMQFSRTDAFGDGPQVVMNILGDATVEVETNPHQTVRVR